MICDQMLCAVSPVVPGKEDTLAAAILAQQASLEALLRGVSKVHFATLALLPRPSPWLDRPGPVGLMFELVIDGDWRCADAVDALIAANARTLWAVYCFVQDAPDVADPPLEWLNRHLCGQLRRTVAGFVGARDRSVVQIQAEAALLAQLQATEVTPAERAAPEALAQRVRAAARGQFPFARTPAPRSFWRQAWQGPWSRALLISVLTVVPGLMLLSYLTALLVFIGELANWVDTDALRRSSLLRSKTLLSLETLASLLLMPVVTTLLVLVARYGRLSTSAAVVGVLAFNALALWAFIASGWALYQPALSGVLVTDVRLSVQGLGLLAAVVLGALLAFVFALAVSPPARGPGPLGLIAALLTFLPLACLMPRLIAQPGRAVALAALVWVGVAAMVLVVILRMPHWTRRLSAWIAKRDRPPKELDAPSRPLQCHPSLTEAEARRRDQVSHMINLCDLRVASKGRLLIWLGQWLSLRLIGFLARTWFVDGQLGKIRDIHFAHWHLLPGWRLLFISNFDGNSVGYWDDFILGASSGVNLAWRWTFLKRRRAALSGHPDVKRDLPYPRTRFGVFLGCRREQHFKSYLRDGMVPPLFRFGAYAQSLSDVERGTLARDTLAAPSNASKDQQLMRLLDA